MMIGLLISLLTIAAMLVLYKNIIASSSDASRAALRDGQVASALLAAQTELQEAGFGIPAQEPLSTRLAVSSDGKQVSWRFKPELGQPDHCAGLRLVDQVPTGNGPPRGLYRLPPKACSSVVGLSWSDTELQQLASQAAFFEPTLKDGSAYGSGEREVGALTLQGSYAFHAATDACMPFRQQDSIEHAGQRVTLRQAADEVLFSVCLPNLALISAP